MQIREFTNKIRASCLFLDDRMKIVRSVSGFNSLKVDPVFNEVALDSTATYRDIYVVAMSRSYYNIILNDYSLFQYSWLKKDSWRLCYLPNPWIAGVEDAETLVKEWEALESMGLHQQDVDGLISELPYHGSIPPIRFEYARDQYRELSHPAAHLHIGRHTQNRWPLARILTPITFSMVIAKMYYSARWAQLSAFYENRVQDCVDLHFIKELSQSPLVHDFTDNERRSLHIASR